MKEGPAQWEDPDHMSKHQYRARKMGGDASSISGSRHADDASGVRGGAGRIILTPSKISMSSLTGAAAAVLAVEQVGSSLGSYSQRGPRHGKDHRAGDDGEDEDENLPQLDPIDITLGGRRVRRRHQQEQATLALVLLLTVVTCLPACLRAWLLQPEPPPAVVVQVRDLDLEVTRAPDWGMPRLGEPHPGRWYQASSIWPAWVRRVADECRCFSLPAGSTVVLHAYRAPAQQAHVPPAPQYGQALPRRAVAA